MIRFAGDPPADPEARAVRQLLNRNGYVRLVNTLKRTVAALDAAVSSREALPWPEQTAREKRAARAAAKGRRRCRRCGCWLNHLNTGDYCHPCQRALRTHGRDD